MKRVTVEILQSREGAVSYTAGSTTTMPLAKALLAARNGWVKILDEPAAVAPKMATPPAPKVAAPALTSVDVILARFGDDVEAMKAYAKKKGINVGRSRSAKTIAKKIAKHYTK